MTYEQLIKKGSSILSEKEDRFDAESDAWWLFSQAASMDRKEFFLSMKKEAPAPVEENFMDLIRRRFSMEPVAYILGEWEFMGMPFYTTPATLIPRQDTETLVETALAYVDRLVRKHPGEHLRLRILDMCTGSGCIAISMAGFLKEKYGKDVQYPGAYADEGRENEPPRLEVQVTAVDISQEALKVARKNADRNGVDIRFLRGDMWSALEEGETFDLILSNPPYIDEVQMKTLPEDVANFEPRTALEGGADGLDFYRILTAGSGSHLNPGGRVFWEIGDEQQVSVHTLISRTDNLLWSGCYTDLTGHDRVVEAEKVG
ncbi:MAG: peptide chain release factor N(5)-glutamine methyltransferase [Lachnospiraceae bacterium]|nr:peptide chain release factor N(5)-glutamine methyltransferase [Lachnospiraceae bacterium]